MLAFFPEKRLYYELMQPQPPQLIQLRKLVKTYGFGDAAHNALDEVNLRVDPGEFIAIMGPSGCGKTTLLNMLGLLDTPDSGTYYLDGTDVSDLNNTKRAQIRAKQIGVVFQSFNLIDRLNVIDNVALPLTYTGMPTTKRLERASEVLNSFQLQKREFYMPYQLSGGQMQRVAIARALVNKPSLILADEPTGNLDSKSSHIIMEELAELHKQGNTIIMVTHNPNLTSYASRVIHMLDGKIASDKKIRVKTSKSESEKITLRLAPAKSNSKQAKGTNSKKTSSPSTAAKSATSTPSTTKKSTTAAAKTPASTRTKPIKSAAKSPRKQPTASTTSSRKSTSKKSGDTA